MEGNMEINRFMHLLVWVYVYMRLQQISMYVYTFPATSLSSAHLDMSGTNGPINKDMISSGKKMIHCIAKFHMDLQIKRHHLLDNLD